MTGYDIYLGALTLLNIAEENNGLKEAVPPLALCALNEIGSDLIDDFSLSDIFGFVSDEKELISAFINGVAMVLSASFNMYNQNAYFTTVYNQKRAIVKNKSTTVKNNIPYVSEAAI